MHVEYDSRGVISALPDIYDGVFCENSLWLLAVFS